MRAGCLPVRPCLTNFQLQLQLHLRDLRGLLRPHPLLLHVRVLRRRWLGWRPPPPYPDTSFRVLMAEEYLSTGPPLRRRHRRVGVSRKSVRCWHALALV